MIALRNWIERQATRVYSHLVARKFRSFAPSSIHPTVRIQNPQNITLGGVAIQRGVWLYAMTGDSAGRVFEPDLRIGAGTQIGAFCHITCAVSVSIGRDVLLAQSVLVADSMHVYKDPEMPIAKQGITCRPTVIGDGCWLGNHAVVVSSSIGRNCVVGANSVVTNAEIPDCCVVVGAPWRVVRRYCAESKQWLRTDGRGNFLGEI
ncbi:MAG: acyltransferase [Limisphaerales bacterium]